MIIMCLIFFIKLSKLKRLKRTAVVKHNYEDKESLSIQEEFDD